MSEQHDNTILHEADVREVIQDEIEETVGQTAESIDDADDSVDLNASTSVALDASTTHALNSVFDDTEVEGALNALGTKINTAEDALNAIGTSLGSAETAINAQAATINDILAVLRTNGLIEEPA